MSFDHVSFQRRPRHDRVGRGVELETGGCNIGLNLRQVVLDLLDAIGGSVGSLGYGQRLIAVSVQILAYLAIGFFRGFGRITTPAPERRKLGDSVGSLERGFGPVASGMKDLADIAGIPPMYIRNRNRHGSRSEADVDDVVASGVDCGRAVFVGLRIGDRPFTQRLRVFAHATE